MNKTIDVLGLGNAIMDILVEVEDDKLLELDLKKGSFALVDKEKAQALLEKIHNEELKIICVPGGSSANTVKGVAFLGGDVLFVGRVGEDEHGELYVQEMHAHGITMTKNTHENTTGHALTFITPDAERSFSVHLGAAIELAKEHVLEEDIAKSKVLHIEGYQLEGPTKETVMHAIELAKKHNTLVSVDLADPGVINRNKSFLEHLVMEHADIVFVNETEAKEFTGLKEENALKKIAQHAKIAVVKLGEHGSLIQSGEEIVKVDAFSAKAVDTTGAGDSYAAGFLYGYCRDWPLDKCGKLGSYLAAKVVEQVGVRISDLSKEEVLKIVE